MLRISNRSSNNNKCWSAFAVAAATIVLVLTSASTASAVANECPAEDPDPGAVCTVDPSLTCSYGEETCVKEFCGEEVTGASMTCVCDSSVWACMMTEFCMITDSTSELVCVFFEIVYQPLYDFFSFFFELYS